MPDPVFLHSNIFKAEVSGGLFGGNDPSKNVAKKSGEFKGLVQVFNKDRKAKRTEQIEANFEKLEENVK